MDETKTLTQTPSETESGGRALDLIDSTFERFLAAASVDAVYGKPVKQGDYVIIPAAEVLSGVGFGAGYGSGSGGSAADSAESQTAGGSGSGGGGGGGGRVLSRPVAVIIASPDGVRVEPVVDATKIALAALTAGGFMLGMLAKMMRGPSKDE